MIRKSGVRTGLRLVAILIAVLAIIDPVATTRRRAKPQVSVVAADSRRDSALGHQVARSLEKRFVVLGGSMSTADATVLVGSRALDDIRDLATPLFVVPEDATSPAISIEALAAPSSSPLDARVPVNVVARAGRASGKTVNASLSIGGVVVQRVSQPVDSSGRTEIGMSFAPTAVGATHVRVAVTVDGARDSSTADMVVDVSDTRWSVLFHDPRPSWMSTFVRRAVERDSRFVVTSRIFTSPTLSIDAGDPPRLDDLAGTSRFDAIVIGAPEALSDRDLVGLEQFLRRRGGSVVFLYDQPSPGLSSKLTRVDVWASSRGRRPVAIGPPHIPRHAIRDSSTFMATQIAWPQTLPKNSEVLARSVSSVPGEDLNDKPVLWRESIGAGRLVVSGALDTWRFRDRSQSAFDQLWRTVVADAASASPPPITARVSPSALSPGEQADVTVWMRDAALRDSTELSRGATTSTASARIVSTDSRQPPMDVRLWPTATVGEFHTTFRAPNTPGAYRLVATGDGVTADAPIVVAATVAHARPSDVDLLGAWASATGGQVVPASELDKLGSMILRAVRPAYRVESWHPMRSAWWILPFALALGGEWLLRRRAGLA